ncbi:MAG TPA: hypothetical protein VIK91_25435, partial [Nannocystis sp.]
MIRLQPRTFLGLVALTVACGDDARDPGTSAASLLTNVTVSTTYPPGSTTPGTPTTTDSSGSGSDSNTGSTTATPTTGTDTSATTGTTAPVTSTT